MGGGGGRAIVFWRATITYDSFFGGENESQLSIHFLELLNGIPQGSILQSLLCNIVIYSF